MNLAPFLCATLALVSAAAAADPPEFAATQPRRGEITRFVTIPGNLRANQQATLFARVPGYLKSLAVEKGDLVQQDQSLGEIDAPELASDLARCEAELAVAQLEFERASNAARKAPDLVTPQALSEADGRRKVAQARLEQVRTLLGYRRLAAPFAGVITQRFVDPGAFIPVPTSGSTQAAAIVTVADFQTIRVQVAVPEIEAALVDRGEPVKFAVEALPGRTFEAKVSRLSYALDEETRTMLVEADVPNPELTLRPGMYATVRLGVETRQGALLVPVEALVMEKTSASVFTIVDGRARKVAVKLGFNDGVMAEIAAGVAEQDRVLLVGKSTVADGQAITVRPGP